MFAARCDYWEFIFRGDFLISHVLVADYSFLVIRSDHGRDPGYSKKQIFRALLSPLPNVSKTTLFATHKSGDLCLFQFVPQISGIITR